MGMSQNEHTTTPRAFFDSQNTFLFIYYSEQYSIWYSHSRHRSREKTNGNHQHQLLRSDRTILRFIFLPTIFVVPFRSDMRNVVVEVVVSVDQPLPLGIAIVIATNTVIAWFFFMVPDG
jgi:hypothetical protein